MKCRTLFFPLLFIVLAASSSYAETATVITKDNALREYCKFFSPVKVAVHYDDVIDLISPSGDWYKARFKGVEGCIHKSAVQKKSVSTAGLKGEGTAKPKDEKHAATEDEVSLAGKGFDQETENAYRADNPELKFDLVDRIEKYAVSEDGLFEFIKKGGLSLQ